MSKKSTLRSKGRFVASIAAASLVVAIPSGGLALTLIGGENAAANADGFASFTPASVDPLLLEFIESRGNDTSRMLRFTPAGANSGDERAVTVAVRIDSEAAQAISVRSAIETAREQAAGNAQRIASTRYNLGLARGFNSFAEAETTVVSPLSRAAIPDLSEFTPSPGVREEPSRFGARISLDEEQGPAQRSPQTLEALGDQSLDVAGSYRLTPNLDVTAGVRYQQDRDHLSPLPNIEPLDSQAVYIGTQFRF